MKIFHTSQYGYLASRIIQSYNDLDLEPELGDLEIKKFPDGEVYHRINSDLNNEDVLVIGGTVDDSETLELFDISCYATRHGAKSLTMIIPYFGYSTMERAVKDGEIVKAKTRAQLLSAIPRANNTNRVVLIDLHSEGISHYFEGGMHTQHLYAKDIIKGICTTDLKAFHDGNFVIASTDAGRAKWVESLAKDMNVDCAVIIKRRLSGSETSVAGVNADVKDRCVIIYDDMIRTGGSLIQAAQTYRKAGAKNVFAISTHGVLPGDSIQKIKASGAIDQVFITDTHPRSQVLDGLASLKGFCTVKSVSGLVARNVFIS